MNVEPSSTDPTSSRSRFPPRDDADFVVGDKTRPSEPRIHAPPVAHPTVQPDPVVPPAPPPDPPYEGRVYSEAAPPSRSRFSIAPSFLGWAVASFFTLVFSTLLILVVGATAPSTFGPQGPSALVAGTTIGAVFIAVFLAYFIGGYTAGRIALVHGVRHGAAIVAWTLLFVILTFLLGGFTQTVVSVTPVTIDTAFDPATLATLGAFALALLLLAMFAGAMLGGRVGTRGGAASAWRTRRTTVRGRPL